MIEALTQRAEEIFYSALEIPSPEQREVFVDRACGGDAALRAEVGKLLSSQPAAEKFFSEGGMARMPMEDLTEAFTKTPGLLENVGRLAGEDEFVGKVIGTYKLLQRIGEGGCGAVYMAEQEKPVRRRVAFKVIKLGMDTKSVIARFEAERQALALMDHPHIARVLDAGATESGRPFFVMELVRGIKITEYCDQNELDTSQRLRLFIQVCQAIQHAHQKGVIHRDIKPSNILVTMIDGKPVPKVIDFGIAKAIEGRLTETTMFTPYEHFIGTPAYMSPEQAALSGVDVDTRSDIYSLGVLLYELLTGRTPFETKELLEKGIDGLRRTLMEREPKRPSALVTTMEGTTQAQIARSRHSEPLKLITQLRGDLDWIVIRALEKDRARRYETANGLALDVERFLSNEAVLARPPSRTYRLQKLVRRNRTTFAAGAMVLFALLCGLGFATRFWLQERDARKRAVLAEQQAHAAEQQQAQLRIQAEDGERVAQAAFLISQNRIDEADALVAKINYVRPSLEAESVLRTLGQWHALKGRWSQAADRFHLLLAADQRDNSWTITEDLLKAGPIFIERGDLQGYERFRGAAITRNINTTDPIFAERSLKVSLLMPADAALLHSLEPLADTAADSMRNAGQNPFMESWRCVSLGLMAYRQGYTPTAKAWCRKCLAGPKETTSRIATAHIIQAMACHALGEVETAQAELAAGKALVDGFFEKGMTEGNGGEGFWFDWLFARILLREAEATTSKPAGSGTN